MRRKITYLLVIATIILGLAGYWHYSKNIYSREVLKLEIIGPETTELAEEVEYLVKYKNNGDVRLEEPVLTFEFPSYTITEDGSLRQEIKEELGEAIYPGEEKTLRFKGRLMGKEGEAKEVKVWLKYRAKNLSAWYESSTTFTTIIEKVPLTFSFDLPSKVESDKDINFRLNYFSNTDYPLSDLRIKVEYPSGFEFIKSVPSALEQKEWDIGLLNKAEGGRIEITGHLTGDVNEQKVFKAELGSWKDGDFILLKEAYKGVEIAEPNIYITQYINGSPEYIATPGDLLHYEVFFKNLGQESLNNLFLVLELNGSAFDLETIKAPTGDYEYGDDSIVFDWRKNPPLQFLDSQEEGMIEFWVNLKEEWPDGSNSVISDKVILSQTREEFENKVNSSLKIVQRGFYEDEVFGNTGPIPPKIGEETTYTITWQAKNYHNQTNNVKVKATLPDWVNLTGKIFPEDESDNFAFDSMSREIVWDVGDLEHGTGVSTDAPNISFQITFVPRSNQKGETPLLISEAKISGEDQWTEQRIETEDDELDTTLSGEEDMGIVK